MKKHVGFTFLFLCFVMLLPLFASCGKPEDIRTFTVLMDGYSAEVTMDVNAAEEVLFSKYYVWDKAGEQAELSRDVELRLMRLSNLPGFSVVYGEGFDLAAENQALCEESIAKASELGMNIAGYTSMMGYHPPAYNAEGSFDPAEPAYYYMITQNRRNLGLITGYIAQLWELEGDLGYEEQKQQITEICIENSKVNYSRTRARPQLFLWIWKKLSTTEQPGHEVYVDAENGYAAVYVRQNDIISRDWELEPCEGELIWGADGITSISRYIPGDDWTYLVERKSGTMFVVKFDRWVTADSEDFENYIAIYGKEPKLHP